jgi:Calcineurin-like phosphoesterase
MNYVIADIHGCKKMLEALLEKMHVRSNDTLIGLGDLVDRGPDTKGVLDLVMGMPNFTALKGNHEEMLLLAMDDPDECLGHWLVNGGAAAFASFDHMIEGKYIRFMESMPHCGAIREGADQHGQQGRAQRHRHAVLPGGGLDHQAARGSDKTLAEVRAPRYGDVLRNWSKVFEIGTGEFLRLPYPEVVLEYSFSDVSHLGPDRLLISKRLVICIEYDPYKDSPLGQTVRSMVGSNTDLSGARSWFSPCSSIPASGCPTLLPPRSRAPGKVAVPASCSSKTGAESNRRSAIPYSRSAESLPAR